MFWDILVRLVLNSLLPNPRVIGLIDHWLLFLGWRNASHDHFLTSPNNSESFCSVAAANLPNDHHSHPQACPLTPQGKYVSFVQMISSWIRQRLTRTCRTCVVTSKTQPLKCRRHKYPKQKGEIHRVLKNQCKAQNTGISMLVYEALTPSLARLCNNTLFVWSQ